MEGVYRETCTEIQKVTEGCIEGWCRGAHRQMHGGSVWRGVQRGVWRGREESLEKKCYRVMCRTGTPWRGTEQECY